MPPSTAAGTPLPGQASAATEIDAPTTSSAISRMRKRSRARAAYVAYHAMRSSHTRTAGDGLGMAAVAGSRFVVTVPPIPHASGQSIGIVSQPGHRSAVSTADEKLTRDRRGGFDVASQHFLDHGGRVVLGPSCQEGAGSAPAVGQTLAVHRIENLPRLGDDRRLDGRRLGLARSRSIAAS